MSRSHDEVPERDEREARFFAWDVPGDAQIVALVYEPDDAERSATVVDAIATSVARRREHTLLLSTEPGPSPLDELLGGAESDGLPAALSGRARLTDVAVQRGDRPFVYLPAGRDPAALAELLDNEVLASFVGRVRERGGTLFMVVSDRTLDSSSIRSMLDGYVVLGDADVADTSALAAFGRVKFEAGWEAPVREKEAEAVSADPSSESRGAVVEAESSPKGRQESEDPGTDGDAREDVEDEPASATDEGLDAPKGADPDVTPDRTSWGRHRARAGFPTGTVVGAAAALLLVAAGWWWFARATEEGQAVAVAEPTRVARPASATGPVPIDAEAARRAFESAPELPYSVQIASFADRGDAEGRIERLRSSGRADDLLILAPTPVRGRVYHRLYAGALPTRAEAEALLAELVEEGEADEATPWALKTARLAFDLGTFSDRASAAARIAELGEKEIPAYALAAQLGTDSVFQVYGGAYESERASLPMAERLDAVGEPASLISRRGIPTLRSSRS